MKIHTEHLEVLVQAFKKNEVLLQGMAIDYILRGRSETRYLWDAFDVARVEGDSHKWLCCKLYSYLNDRHMDTALRHASKQIGVTY
jgi:hypothetical protein